ncbi:hypothetical protein [Microvirga calopogonii]|uniref:hypothetical protein n=1 Tax=Microvirga calopogonii TaxID=2078013 RepID=UPI0013B3A7DB|nr:hypothetical protein [Microvirga calopogonii]
MLNIPRNLSATLLIGLASVCCTGLNASAQPLTLRVSPSAPRVFTDREGTWERVPVSDLWTTGERYDEPSGVRIGRGSVIPNWVETSPMRNVSIRRLRHYGHYGYFVSPDDRLVIVNPASHRVARVVRHSA